MAIVMRLEAPARPLEQYDKAMAIMGINGDDDAPDGLIQHIAPRARRRRSSSSTSGSRRRS